MAVISSNTLFHFTNSAERIINIIKNGFAPKFCLEELGPDLFFKTESKNESAIPMSCFCDLPLSQIDKHLEFYGSYGIGLSKEWGKQNGLTPLTYIHDNSTQVKYLKQLGYLIGNVFSKISDEELDKLPMELNPMIALFELSAFYKPYNGQMWRINKYVDKRFYDEREWRYVPFVNLKKETDYRLSKDEFLNDIKRASANDTISKTFLLNFKCEDVKYIIVSKETEMIALFDAIDSMTEKFSEDERKVLKTKIISTEQITEDF
ncbi:abortive infection system antitoxin AbiGi family protein [Psychroflexus sp. ALD_RP9]|uniref:abortive infection system antitoxin AbiGi family protein n=1 Tax=Psychroflexus sp. ALD_RP9 TaxID=2777186 RepID=UPI001A8DDAAE|nr:abortive infection system antitoxin AbiGi family protein [Psychroflexus sp. ALD_RP9]QSS96636.1 hypothetical protein IMZ30_09305 [Psychroflexus sp. ALD_RP9]